MNLSEQEKQHVLELIKNNEKLPKEYIYKLFADEEDVFLFWNGRKEDVTNVALPFHSIEHIDEPRKEFDAEPGLFDTKGRQLKGWTNKLIWGDNKLILSSLANGPLREEIEKEGGIKLIYIDPPYAVGADFSFEIEINGENATKKQSLIEEIAYRDTWGRGVSSYLNMMYERLKLLFNLLSNDGTIYVHCDWRVNNWIKILLDDLFKKQNFRNEIAWCYRGGGVPKNDFAQKHDTIFRYTKSDEYIFNLDDVRIPYSDDVMSSDPSRYDKSYRSNKVYEGYKPNEMGKHPEDWWTIQPLMPSDKTERVNYPTQKPVELIQRIIDASSNPGDIVLDAFCGSGTTAVVAEGLRVERIKQKNGKEKLNYYYKEPRKWIACDLGRFAIHTTRKRMIQVQREKQEAGKDFRAFEVLNLGKYERQFFMDDLNNGQREQKEITYKNLILEAYKATPVEEYGQIHGKKVGRWVHVGPLDVPVTQTRLQEIFDECKKNLFTQVDVLGFEFEMGLQPRIVQEYREQGVEMQLKYIPKDVFDKRAVEKGQVKFYEVSYLRAEPKIDGNEVRIELKDFVTNYTQDDIEDIQESMRKRSSKVVIENGQIVKIEKDPDGIINREVLTENWYDWIDYWSVDFQYEDKKEIIRVQNEAGETEEKWTGNYIFENEWQSFRTKQENELEFISAPHTYEKPGNYKAMVKVIDILGIDTSQVVEIEIK